MPRAIAVITKELQLKRSTVAKTDAAVNQREIKRGEQAKIISDLRPEMDKLGKLIATNEKAIKDPKTKKENIKGLQAQKLKAENELAPMQKKMDAAHKEYEVCQNIIATLKKNDQPIYDTIDKLEEELRLTTEGLQKYGAERVRFRDWYAGEITRMQRFSNMAIGAATIADRLRAATVADIEKGAVESAKTNATKARNAANAARVNADSLKDAASKIVQLKTTGRNLSPTAYNIVAADAQAHAVVNKAVLNLFAVEDQLKNKTQTAATEAEESATEAETWVSMGAKTAQNTAKVLASTLETLNKLDVAIGQLATQTWGKNITEGGAPTTKILNGLKANPQTMLPVALKAYEQGSAYVPEALNRVRTLVERIQKGSDKAVAGVSPEFRKELDQPINALLNLAKKNASFLQTFEGQAVKALDELEKLREATEALS